MVYCNARALYELRLIAGLISCIRPQCSSFAYLDHNDFVYFYDKLLMHAILGGNLINAAD